MQIVYRPNFKMMLCGLFNGDTYTYANNMVELDPRFIHNTSIRCAHIPPIMPYSETDDQRFFELDVYDVRLEMINMMGVPFLAGRCLTCGRIFYCPLPVP